MPSARQGKSTPGKGLACAKAPRQERAGYVRGMNIDQRSFTGERMWDKISWGRESRVSEDLVEVILKGVGKRNCFKLSMDLIFGFFPLFKQIIPGKVIFIIIILILT